MTSITPTTIAEYTSQIRTLLQGASVNTENITNAIGRALLTKYPRLDGILCTPTQTSIDFINNQSVVETDYKIFDVYNAKVTQTFPVLENATAVPLNVIKYPQPQYYANIIYNITTKGAPSTLIVYNNQYTLYPIEIDKSYRVDAIVHLSLMRWNEDVTDEVLSRVPNINKLLLLYSSAYELCKILGVSLDLTQKIKLLLDDEIANLSPIQSMQSNRGGGDVIASRYSTNTNSNSWNFL